MFQKSQAPIITNNNELHCPTHSEAIQELSIKTAFSEPQIISLLCPKCSKPGLFEKIRKAHFQAYSQYQTYIISFDDTTASIKNQTSANPPLNFLNSRLEHIIIDNQSPGYSLRNLVYIPNKSILAACSTNGKIVFWAFNNKLEPVKEYFLNTEIDWAKYLNLGEGKEYLMIARHQEVHILNISDINSCAQVAKITCEHKINSIEYITQHNKLVTAGGDGLIRVWNPEDFSLESRIQVDGRDQGEPIFSLTYLEPKGILIIEDRCGVYFISSAIINEEKEDNKATSPITSFNVADRQQAGFCPLPNTNQFALMLEQDHTYLLNEALEPTSEYLKEYSKLKKGEKKEEVDYCEKKYIPNPNESQILANSYKSCRILVYENAGCNYLNLKGLVKELGGLELLNNQYRFVVADQALGTILVFRTNVTLRPESSFFSFQPFEPSEPAKAVPKARVRQLDLKSEKKARKKGLLPEIEVPAPTRKTRSSNKIEVEETKDTEEDEEKEEKEATRGRRQKKNVSEDKSKSRDKKLAGRRINSEKKESVKGKRTTKERESREKSRDVEKEKGKAKKQNQKQSKQK